MRILCDNNVANKYVRAFREADGFQAVLVREELHPRATDRAIAGFARTTDRVVFTNDDDFHTGTVDHGLILYSQIENPFPGDVVRACRSIDSAYENPTEITEFVPDGWL